MNELESELGAMSLRSSTRDLKVAALCAHRDSQVLTAKRLRRELTVDELDTAFDVLEQKYPGLVAREHAVESSMAIAIMRTPNDLPASTAAAATATVPARASWMNKLAMAAALLICFAGGLAVGIGPGRPSAGTVADVPPAADAVVNDAPAFVAGSRLSAQVAESSEHLERSRSVRQASTGQGRNSVGIRTSFPGKKKSSLYDMSRAYYRMRFSAANSSL